MSNLTSQSPFKELIELAIIELTSTLNTLLPKYNLDLTNLDNTKTKFRNFLKNMGKYMEDHLSEFMEINPLSLNNTNINNLNLNEVPLNNISINNTSLNPINDNKLIPLKLCKINNKEIIDWFCLIENNRFFIVSKNSITWYEMLLEKSNNSNKSLLKPYNDERDKAQTPTIYPSLYEAKEKYVQTAPDYKDLAWKYALNFTFISSNSLKGILMVPLLENTQAKHIYLFILDSKQPISEMTVSMPSNYSTTYKAVYLDVIIPSKKNNFRWGALIACLMPNSIETWILWEGQDNKFEMESVFRQTITCQNIKEMSIMANKDEKVFIVYSEQINELKIYKYWLDGKFNKLNHNPFKSSNNNLKLKHILQIDEINYLGIFTSATKLFLRYFSTSKMIGETKDTSLDSDSSSAYILLNNNNYPLMFYKNDPVSQEKMEFIVIELNANNAKPICLHTIKYEFNINHQEEKPISLGEFLLIYCDNPHWYPPGWDAIVKPSSSQ